MYVLGILKFGLADLELFAQLEELVEFADHSRPHEERLGCSVVVFSPGF